MAKIVGITKESGGRFVDMYIYRKNEGKTKEKHEKDNANLAKSQAQASSKPQGR